jgi:hypothetical protein
MDSIVIQNKVFFRQKPTLLANDVSGIENSKPSFAEDLKKFLLV